MPHPQWKGKARAVSTTVIEGSGGNDGVVLSMDLVGDGIYNAAYVVAVTVGRQTNPRTFSLQVDTGSSDLWIAASPCNTPSCNQCGPLYNPTTSQATSTGIDFTIDYLQGHVDGPVYWDLVNIGGYAVENQALAAGTTVDNEPLTPKFMGILGLALPLNSVIAENLPPVTNNDPDGAAWASNLFSITPVTNAPAFRFLSMTLSRPGSDRIASTLGIGRHPSSVADAVQNGQVQYSNLVAERTGTLFWKTSVRGITVYQDGVRKPILLGRGVMGSAYPTAVLDSGVPLIWTSSAIANGIYGALGINPAQDGSYYVPCSTPLNMTITLDNRTEIPLHPLDLTANPPGNVQTDTCIGLIQAADAQLAQPNSIGDMILGVPFLRNVYSVMAYTEPNADGSFSLPLPVAIPDSSSNTTDTTDPTTNTTSSSTSTTSTTGTTTNSNTSMITPSLGLLPLTDPTTALQEFTTVRILGAPIPPSSNSSSRPPSNGGGKNPLTDEGAGGDGRTVSVGIIVLVALVGFVVLCFVLFGVRWWMIRRVYRKGGEDADADIGGVGGGGGRESGSGASTPRMRERGSGSGRGRGPSSSLETEGYYADGTSSLDAPGGLVKVDRALGSGGGGYGVAQRQRASQASSSGEGVPVVVGMEPGYEVTPLAWPTPRNDMTALSPPYHHSSFHDNDAEEEDDDEDGRRSAPYHLRSQSQEREVRTSRAAGAPLLDHVDSPPPPVRSAYDSAHISTPSTASSSSRTGVGSPPLSPALLLSTYHPAGLARLSLDFPPSFTSHDLLPNHTERESESGPTPTTARTVMMMAGIGTASRTTKINIDGVFTGGVHYPSKYTPPRRPMSNTEEEDGVVIIPGQAL